MRKLTSSAFLSFLALGAGLAAQVPVTDGHRIYALSGSANGYAYSVTRLGDIDGDGVEDLAIGAPGQAHGANTRAGVIEIRSADDGRLHGRICGTAQDEILGSFVRAVGDVDRDGRPDILALADLANKEARVYSGRTGTVIRRWRKTTPADGLASIGAVGDVNRDGHADFVLGAVGVAVGTSKVGAAFVVSGKDNSTLFRMNGIVHDGLFGRAVAGAGDVDADGYPDIAVTAMSENRPTQRRTGAVRVYSGRNGSLLWTYYGPFERAYLGIHVASIGDVDGDGRPDLVASGIFKSTIPGLVVVLSGKDGTLVRRAPVPTGLHPVMTANGVGDIDGDRRADYAVGYYRPTTPPSGGQMNIYSGRTGAVLRHWTGFESYPTSVDLLGDVNGDGASDIVVGHWIANGSTGPLDGVATMVSTKKLSLVTDVHEIHACTGGVQEMSLDAGTAHSGKAVWFLGSLSGIAPGFRLSGLHIPLNLDPYLLLTSGSRGLITFDAGARLDGNGKAKAKLTVPALPFAPAMTAHHAFVVIGSAGLDFVSNAAPVRLTR